MGQDRENVYVRCLFLDYIGLFGKSLLMYLDVFSVPLVRQIGQDRESVSLRSLFLTYTGLFCASLFTYF